MTINKLKEENSFPNSKKKTLKFLEEKCKDVENEWELFQKCKLFIHIIICYFIYLKKIFIIIFTTLTILLLLLYILFGKHLLERKQMLV